MRLNYGYSLRLRTSANQGNQSSTTREHDEEKLTEHNYAVEANTSSEAEDSSEEKIKHLIPEKECRYYHMRSRRPENDPSDLSSLLGYRILISHLPLRLVRPVFPLARG